MARDEAYQEAERRIKAVCQEEATELDLSGIGLAEVSEAIALLKLKRGRRSPFYFAKIRKKSQSLKAARVVQNQRL